MTGPEPKHGREQRKRAGGTRWDDAVLVWNGLVSRPARPKAQAPEPDPRRPPWRVETK